MMSVVGLIDLILQLYTWVVIAYVILTWLVQFNVVNRQNQFVNSAGDFLSRATEPALAPIRRVVPYLGGIDISPVVLLLLLWLARSLLWEYGPAMG
ncbi:MAG: YggT family protein [Alphaproteobacteria bacterium]|nr:YggT family protein [Alphaproteobacteria bacterium]